GTREWVGLKLPKPVVSLTFTNKHLKFWHDPFVCSTIVYHKPVKIFSILNHFPINYHSQMITYIITLLINTYTIMDHILPYLTYIHTLQNSFWILKCVTCVHSLLYSIWNIHISVHYLCISNNQSRS